MATLVRQEQDLATACSERGLPLLLLRPTLVYGCGRDRNVSYLASLARRLKVVPLAGRAAGLRQPVHADDLADLCVRALTATHPVDLTSEACGGSTLTYRDMVQKAAAAAPGRHRLVTLPVGLMRAVLWLVSGLPGWRDLSPEMARRQNRNLVFDDSGLREALGWSPRPFEPSAADFEVPDYARALQLPPEEP
jgi:nucleoside-diphosphate-sugar epimerase